MVVAQQMQQAVHDEMLEMVPGLDAALGRLLLHRLGRQHDVAQVGAVVRRRSGRRWNGKDSTLVGASLPR